MEIVLLERVEKLGQMGDVVRVKPGYARNFLLPRKKALRATKENMEVFKAQHKQLEAKNVELRGEAEKIAKALEGMSVTMIRSAGENGQLYGSVTARDIAQGVTAEGVTIDRSQVVMAAPIKSLGLHDMRVALHPEVSVTVVVNAARSNEEAVKQIKTGRAVTNQRDEEDRQDREEAARAAAEQSFEAPPEEDLVASVTDDIAAEPEAEAPKPKKAKKAKADDAESDEAASNADAGDASDEPLAASDEPDAGDAGDEPKG